MFSHDLFCDFENIKQLYGSIVKCIKSEMYKFEILNINRREQEF
jgi:hypothetical protein